MKSAKEIFDVIRSYEVPEVENLKHSQSVTSSVREAALKRKGQDGGVGD